LFCIHLIIPVELGSGLYPLLLESRSLASQSYKKPIVTFSKSITTSKVKAGFKVSINNIKGKRQAMK